MCFLLEGPPSFENRGGIVHITDQYGERAMSLGDFVTASRVASRLARQWVAEANEPTEIGRRTRVKG